MVANQQIYEERFESNFFILVKLLATCSNWHIPYKCVDYFAQILMSVPLPTNNIRKNFYEATRLASILRLKVEMIYCCENGSMLFYIEDSNLDICKFCNKLRFAAKTDIWVGIKIFH
jgi:hypothetical protein